MQKPALYASMENWIARPFSLSMDAEGWVLFVSLIAVTALLWRGVLSKLFSALE